MQAQTKNTKTSEDFTCEYCKSNLILVIKITVNDKKLRLCPDCAKQVLLNR